jgi:hypothetical protein
MTRSPRPLAALIAVAMLWPSLATAQATRAGVVTTLEGTVTARRVALPAPVPLKFKDDVFLQDRVTTGDRSLARMLLGGKAVVTVRERSVLTITEVPGKSTIEHENGKFGLAVAREKMRSGEEILIRTPNAIAGVRGTVVITEVSRQRTQAGGAAPAVVTHFYVLRGTIWAQRLDPNTGQPVGPQLQVGTLQAYSGAGSAAPQVTPIAPEQVGQITAGLSPTGVQGGSEAGSEMLKAQALESTLSLLAVLSGADNQVAAISEPPVSLSAPTTSSTETPSTTSLTTAAPIIPPISEALASEEIQALIDEINFAVNITGSVSVTGGKSLKKFSGTTVLKTTAPVVTVTAANVTQTGVDDDLISVSPTASVTLAGPLAKVVNSTLTTDGAFFGVDAGTVTSGTASPFIDFDPVAVTTGDSFVYVDHGALTLSGSLFKDTGGTLTIHGNLLEITHATLTGSGTESLFQLDGTTLSTPGRSVLFFDGDGLPTHLAGGLLTAAGSTFTDGANFLFIGDTAVSSSASDAFLQLAGSAVTGTGNFVHVNGASNGTSPTSLSLGGPLLVSTNSAITEGSNLLRIVDGASVSSTTTSPFVSILGGSFKGGGPVNTSSGGSLLRMFSEVGRPGATLALTGPFATIANASITTTDSDTFNLADGSTITSATSSPFASFASSAVTAAFSFFDLATNTSFGTPLVVGSGAPATVSLAGSLIDATDTTFTVQNGSFFRMRNGVTLTQTGSSPLLRLTGTSPGGVVVDPSANFAALTSGAAAAPRLSLGGQFLVATNATLSSGDPTQNTSSFLFVGDGAQATSSSTSPFMSFTGSTVDTAGDILSLRRSTATTPSRLTLAGPLFAAVNSTFNHTTLGFGAAFGVPASTCCNAFGIGQGAQLTSTSPEALIQLTGSTVIGNDAQSGGNFFFVFDSFGGAPASEVVAPASVSLAGPLLKATSSTITSLFDLLQIRRSSLSSTSPDPLIDITGGSVTLGGTNPITGAPASGRFVLVFSSTTPGIPASPASMAIAGPIARLTGTTVGSTDDVLLIANGGTLAAGGGSALMQLDSTNLSGFNLLDVGNLGGPQGTSPASVTSAGPILSATSSTITLGSNVIGIFDGGSFTSTTTAPLIQLAGTALTAGTSFNGAEVLQANGGASPALISLRGPVLSAGSGSTLNIPGALLGTFSGGRVVVSGSTDPLFFFGGGSHTFATVVTASSDAAFMLNGLATETANEIADGVPLVLGTRKPLEHAGTFLEAAGADLTTNKVMRVDTALVEASAPILHLRPGSASSLTTASDAIDLLQRAKLTSIGPVIKLDASTLTVNSGAAVLVRGGSFLRVTGDLLALSNGATLRMLNGPALSVTDNSVVNISGAFVNFGGTGGNQINVTNTLCVSSCASIGGLNVNLINGAVAGNVSINDPIKNGTLGAINLSNGSTTAVISVSGASSKVTISGN